MRRGSGEGTPVREFQPLAGASATPAFPFQNQGKFRERVGGRAVLEISTQLTYTHIYTHTQGLHTVCAAPSSEIKTQPLQ